MTCLRWLSFQQAAGKNKQTALMASLTLSGWNTGGQQEMGVKYGLKAAAEKAVLKKEEKN